MHKGYEPKFASCPAAADAVVSFKRFLVGVLCNFRVRHLYALSTELLMVLTVHCALCISQEEGESLPSWPGYLVEALALVAVSSNIHCAKLC